MEPVGAGLHGVVEVTPARLAILGREIARLDGDFLDGVRSRLIDLGVLLPETIAGILAFNVDGLRTGWHPINAQGVISREIGARQQFERGQWVPDISQPGGVSETVRRAGEREDRQIVQSLGRDVVAYLR